MTRTSQTVRSRCGMTQLTPSSLSPTRQRLASFAGNMGMGVLPGDVGMFYYDGYGDLHPMSVTDNDMSIIEVRAVDDLAGVGGSHTDVFRWRIFRWCDAGFR
jgi:hypothetical protein